MSASPEQAREDGQRDSHERLRPLHSELSGRREVSAEPHAELGDVPDWMGRGAWLLSGALAATVVLALVVWEPERYANPGSSDGSSVGPEVGAGGLSPTIVRLAEARVVQGSVRRDGASLPVDAPLREGDELELAQGACLSIEPGIRLCAVLPSELSLRSLARSQRVLEVHVGRVTARLPEASEAEFVLRHEGLRASARQGTFAFGAQPALVEVWVGRGPLEVSRQSERKLLASNQGARFTDEAGLTTFELDASQRTVLALRPSQAAAGGPRGGSARRRAAAPRPSVPPSPPSTTASEASPASVAEQGTVVDLVETAPDAGTEGAAVQVQAPPPAVAVDEAQSELGEPEAALALAHANALRDAGRAADAEAAYAQVVSAHPTSAAARRAAVALGDLRLRRLANPLGALRAYQTFQENAPPGRLDARARLGAIEAHGRLNQFAKERKAIEDFISRYPGSAEIPRLKARRTFLGG